MADATTFFVPTKPLTLIQAINRVAAATGSINHAAAAHHADYNGHYNTLTWNDYRGYYVGEYFWAGRHVFVRNADFAPALAATLREFDRQGAGASLLITPRPEDVVIATANPRLLPWSADAQSAADASWRDWRHGEIALALRMEQQLGVPHLVHLREATDPADYRARLKAEFGRRRAERQAIG